jgi:hypothetical protein
MQAEIEITNGKNIIDILFNDFASCLIIKKAMAVNWPDCRGSIGEYYAISDYSVEERNFYTRNIDQALSVGSDTEQLEAITDFLHLFADGKYGIHKSVADIGSNQFLKGNQVRYSDTVPKDERFSGWYFPDYQSNLSPKLFTITNDKIDNARVEYYCELIRKGIKPTVLIFESCNMLSSEYSCPYVLDGHHKIEAYIRLNENIPFINILKLEENPDQTASLLHHAKTILKDFEYRHLFENSDEHLLPIDFINDPDLTDDIDHILKNSDKIEVSIIEVLRKHNGTGDQSIVLWLEKRLANLKKNPNVSLFGFSKGIRVYEKKDHPTYGVCWYPEALKNSFHLNDWIRNTIR